jgi:hypothetical protein
MFSRMRLVVSICYLDPKRIRQPEQLKGNVRAAAPQNAKKIESDSDFQR